LIYLVNYTFSLLRFFSFPFGLPYESF
jgi:hypothetical protein